MKTKLLGALTGVLVGLSLVLIVPAGAQAASWSNYVTGNYAPGIKQSGTGKVLQNRGRIFAPGGGVGYSVKYSVKVASRTGAVTASGATQPGVWFYQTATSPQTNTIARCELYGPYATPGGDYLCDVQK